MTIWDIVTFIDFIYIFAAMNLYFKIIIFSLISCCYINTVFEFSDNEEKLNFEKESHCYTYQETLKLDLSQITTQNNVAVIESNFQPQTVHYPVVISKTTTNNHLNKFCQPPQRRYILYASLLI